MKIACYLSPSSNCFRPVLTFPFPSVSAKYRRSGITPRETMDALYTWLSSLYTDGGASSSDGALSVLQQQALITFMQFIKVEGALASTLSLSKLLLETAGSTPWPEDHALSTSASGLVAFLSKQPEEVHVPVYSVTLNSSSYPCPTASFLRTLIVEGGLTVTIITEEFTPTVSKLCKDFDIVKPTSVSSSSSRRTPSTRLSSGVGSGRPSDFSSMLRGMRGPGRSGRHGTPNMIPDSDDDDDEDVSALIRRMRDERNARNHSSFGTSDPADMEARMMRMMMREEIPGLDEDDEEDDGRPTSAELLRTLQEDLGEGYPGYDEISRVLSRDIASSRAGSANLMRMMRHGMGSIADAEDDDEFDDDISMSDDDLSNVDIFANDDDRLIASMHEEAEFEAEAAAGVLQIHNMVEDLHTNLADGHLEGDELQETLRALDLSLRNFRADGGELSEEIEERINQIRAGRTSAPPPVPAPTTTPSESKIDDGSAVEAKEDEVEAEEKKPVLPKFFLHTPDSFSENFKPPPEEEAAKHLYLVMSARHSDLRKAGAIKHIPDLLTIGASVVYFAYGGRKDPLSMMLSNDPMQPFAKLRFDKIAEADSLASQIIKNLGDREGIKGAAAAMSSSSPTNKSTSLASLGRQVLNAAASCADLYSTRMEDDAPSLILLPPTILERPFCLQVDGTTFALLFDTLKLLLTQRESEASAGAAESKGGDPDTDDANSLKVTIISVLKLIALNFEQLVHSRVDPKHVGLTVDVLKQLRLTLGDLLAIRTDDEIQLATAVVIQSGFSVLYLTKDDRKIFLTELVQSILSGTNCTGAQLNLLDLILVQTASSDATVTHFFPTKVLSFAHDSLLNLLLRLSVANHLPSEFKNHLARIQTSVVQVLEAHRQKLVARVFSALKIVEVSREDNKEDVDEAKENLEAEEAMECFICYTSLVVDTVGLVREDVGHFKTQLLPSFATTLCLVAKKTPVKIITALIPLVFTLIGHLTTGVPSKVFEDANFVLAMHGANCRFSEAMMAANGDIYGEAKFSSVDEYTNGKFRWEHRENHVWASFSPRMNELLETRFTQGEVEPIQVRTHSGDFRIDINGLMARRLDRGRSSARPFQIRRHKVEKVKKKGIYFKCKGCSQCTSALTLPPVPDVLRILATVGGLLCRQMVAGPIVASEEEEVMPWLNTLLFHEGIKTIPADVVPFDLPLPVDDTGVAPLMKTYLPTSVKKVENTGKRPEAVEAFVLSLAAEDSEDAKRLLSWMSKVKRDFLKGKDTYPAVEHQFLSALLLHGGLGDEALTFIESGKDADMPSELMGKVWLKIDWLRQLLRIKRQTYLGDDGTFEAEEMGEEDVAALSSGESKSTVSDAGEGETKDSSVERESKDAEEGPSRPSPESSTKLKAKTRRRISRDRPLTFECYLDVCVDRISLLTKLAPVCPLLLSGTDDDDDTPAPPPLVNYPSVTSVGSEDMWGMGKGFSGVLTAQEKLRKRSGMKAGLSAESDVTLEDKEQKLSPDHKLRVNAMQAVQSYLIHGGQAPPKCLLAILARRHVRANHRALGLALVHHLVELLPLDVAKQDVLLPLRQALRGETELVARDMATAESTSRHHPLIHLEGVSKAAADRVLAAFRSVYHTSVTLLSSHVRRVGGAGMVHAVAWICSMEVVPEAGDVDNIVDNRLMNTLRSLFTLTTSTAPASIPAVVKSRSPCRCTNIIPGEFILLSLHQGWLTKAMVLEYLEALVIGEEKAKIKAMQKPESLIPMSIEICMRMYDTVTSDAKTAGKDKDSKAKKRWLERKINARNVLVRQYESFLNLQTAWSLFRIITAMTLGGANDRQTKNVEWMCKTLLAMASNQEEEDAAKSVAVLCGDRIAQSVYASSVGVHSTSIHGIVKGGFRGVCDDIKTAVSFLEAALTMSESRLPAYDDLDAALFKHQVSTVEARLHERLLFLYQVT